MTSMRVICVKAPKGLRLLLKPFCKTAKSK